MRKILKTLAIQGDLGNEVFIVKCENINTI